MYDYNDPYEMHVQKMEAEAQDNAPGFISKAQQESNREFGLAFNHGKKHQSRKITVTELPGYGNARLVRDSLRPQHLTWIPF